LYAKRRCEHGEGGVEKGVKKFGAVVFLLTFFFWTRFSGGDRNADRSRGDREASGGGRKREKMG